MNASILKVRQQDGSVVEVPAIIGPQGPAGPAGSDATVTADSIKSALGYTPADEETVSQLSVDLAAGTDGQFATSDGAGGIKWITMPTYNGEVENA